MSNARESNITEILGNFPRTCGNVYGHRTEKTAQTNYSLRFIRLNNGLFNLNVLSFLLNLNLKKHLYIARKYKNEKLGFDDWGMHIIMYTYIGGIDGSH